MTEIEIGDLEELISGKGWTWLKAQAEREFGPAAMVEKLRKIANAVEDPALKQAKTEQAFVSQAAILGFLEMPAREISKQREAVARPGVHAGMQRGGL